MKSNDLLTLIDAEIANLTEARSILASLANSSSIVATSQNAKQPKTKGRKKRRLTPEGRARIAEAAKKRWAAQKAKQKGKA